MGNEQSKADGAKGPTGFPAGGANGKKRAPIFPTRKNRKSSKSSAPTVSSAGSGGATSVYEPQKVVIIGSGPVGALAALYFAKGGWQVVLYELRGDLRHPENRSLNFTKSINLAISERGLNGLRMVDPELLDTLLEDTIPMSGRMIHDRKGRQSGQRYDSKGRSILAIDRSTLNGRLLDELDKMNNVELKFNHNLRSLALEKNEATFERRHYNGDYENVRVQADLFIGADGAHSQVRRQIMKYVRLNYSQEYIDSLWCELQIPAGDDGEFKLDPNHLHIWPRQTFMFIAIPSLDKSFTCTLFMPEEMFKEINGPEALITFFKKEFPDVIPLIGENKLVADYLKNSKLPLISVKCTPYHYRDKCVLIGDASHAMVPFYGQGMNCGFEDVRVLWEHITNDVTISAALDAYTAERHPDCVTICDLAMDNYVEMRSSVTSYRYLLKKGVQEFLYSWLPFLGVRTLYSMVSFSNIRYSHVTKRMKRQERILSAIGTIALFGGLGVGGYYAWKKNMFPTTFKILKDWQEQIIKGQFDFRNLKFSGIGGGGFSSSSVTKQMTSTVKPVETPTGLFGKLFG